MLGVGKHQRQQHVGEQLQHIAHRVAHKRIAECGHRPATFRQVIGAERDDGRERQRQHGQHVDDAAPFGPQEQVDAHQDTGHRQDQDLGRDQHEFRHVHLTPPWSE